MPSFVARNLLSPPLRVSAYHQYCMFAFSDPRFCGYLNQYFHNLFSVFIRFHFPDTIHHHHHHHHPQPHHPTPTPPPRLGHELDATAAYLTGVPVLHTHSFPRHSAVAKSVLFSRVDLTFRRRIKSHLPFAGIIRSSPYSTRFQDKG